MWTTTGTGQGQGRAQSGSGPGEPTRPLAVGVGLRPASRAPSRPAGRACRDRDARRSRPQLPLAAIGGIGLFTKEIQRALLDSTVEIAVHSLKDLPTQGADALILGAVPVREDAADALIAPTHRTLDALPAGAKIGTGSLRRRAQLLHARPDLQVVGIRGNVETRLNQALSGTLDGVVLAEAGLRRLELEGTSRNGSVRPCSCRRWGRGPSASSAVLRMRRPGRCSPPWTTPPPGGRDRRTPDPGRAGRGLHDPPGRLGPRHR